MSRESPPGLNLLTDPLITVETAGGVRALSLPGVLEALGREQDIVFTQLRPHQRHAWYALLVQLAALALHRAGTAEIAQAEGTWTALLRAMTDEVDEPWCLAVADLGRPAFLQAPVPAASLQGWKRVTTPAALDILVTAKNHDVKARPTRAGSAELWLFALASLQTMEGFLGAGNYGISRMNGGFASRPCVAVAPGQELPSRFQRDVSTLLVRRPEMVREPWPYSAHGFHLLWLLPWDGESSLSLDSCDPYFIEICRRVRLVVQDGKLSAVTAGSKVARLDAKELNGVTGDPWTPVSVSGPAPKALTVSARGFSYELLHDILFSGAFKPGMAWRQEGDRGDLLLTASALARGQGKTEGLHQREVMLPGRVTSLLASANGRSELARRSSERIKVTDTVQRRVLHLALCVVTQGAAPKLDLRDSSTAPWRQAFDQAVDEVFFERLFSQVDDEPDAAALAWEREVIDLARRQLEHAIATVPQPSLRRYRIESAAFAMFDGCARKHFPELATQPRRGADDE